MIKMIKMMNMLKMIWIRNIIKDINIIKIINFILMYPNLSRCIEMNKSLSKWIPLEASESEQSGPTGQSGQSKPIMEIKTNQGNINQTEQSNPIRAI